MFYALDTACKVVTEVPTHLHGSVDKILYFNSLISNLM